MAKEIPLSEKEIKYLVACIYTATDEGGPYGQGSDSLTRIEELELYRKLGIDESAWFIDNIKKEIAAKISKR